jgi:hypothetical protein
MLKFSDTSATIMKQTLRLTRIRNFLPGGFPLAVAFQFARRSAVARISR